MSSPKPDSTDVNVQTHTVGAFQENSYLVVDDRTYRAVIVDPGGEGDKLVDAIDNSAAKLEAIWITHASSFRADNWSPHRKWPPSM